MSAVLTLTTVPGASPVPVTYGHDPAAFRWTAGQYRRMVEVGILTKEHKVELLEGYVVLKMPRGPRHDGTIQRTLRPLLRALPTGWDIRIQSAIALSDGEPEPDFALVRPSPDEYMTHHPTPAEVGLLVEVADSSLLRDQRDKTRTYGRDGITEYWIINLPDGRVEVYTQPSGQTAAPGYAATAVYHPGDLVPLVLDGATVAHVPAADLLH